MDFSKASIHVFYISSHQQHVTLQVRHLHLPCPITLSFVHAGCKREDRVSLWEDLLSSTPENSPWLLCGDFHLVLNSQEKRGGRTITNVEILEFSSFLSELGLFENGFSGSTFTWCNNRRGRTRIWKRLDRLLINSECSEPSQKFSVKHLARDPSDHAPLLVSSSTRLDNKPKMFRSLMFGHHKCNY